MSNFQLFSFQKGFKISELSNNIAGFNSPFSIDYEISGLNGISFADLALSKKISIDEIETICDNLKDNYELLLKRMYSLSSDNDNIYANLKNIKHICITVDYYNYGSDIVTKLDNYKYEFLSTIIAIKDKYNFIPIFSNNVAKYYFKLLDTKRDWRGINVWNSCVFNLRLDNIEDMKLIKGQNITNSIINLELNMNNMTSDYLLELLDVVNYLKRIKNNVVSMNSNDIESIIHWNTYGTLKFPPEGSKGITPEYRMVDFSNMIIYTSQPLFNIPPFALNINDNNANIDSSDYIFENTLFTNMNMGPGIAKAIMKYDRVDDIVFDSIHNISILFNTNVFDIKNSYIPYSVYLRYNKITAENKYVKVHSNDINTMLEDGIKDFKDMIISNVTIDGKDLNKVDFTNSSLRNVTFLNCKDFDKAIWNDTDIYNCILTIKAFDSHLSLFLNSENVWDSE
jgi:uncharacterized protein YjbI with pentapeptide repeats